MRKIPLAQILAGVLAVCALAGCARSLVSENWGRAQRESVDQMTADPGAAERYREPVTGLDASTAEQVMKTYRKVQAEPPREAGPPSIINIGVEPR